MRRNKCINFEERKKLETFLKKKMYISDISEILGIHQSTLYSEVKKNGGRENYDSNAAHDKCLQLRHSRYSKCLTLTKRVENLEFQIEILIQQLKGKQ